MNAADIRKLRYKFIFVSMMSIFVVMVFLGTAINLVSYSFVVNSIRRQLDGIIAQNGVREAQNSSDPGLADIFTPDYNHNHFFVNSYDAQGTVQETRSNSTDADELATVETYMQVVYNRRAAFGRHDDYFFLKRTQADGGTKIAMLDCSTEVSAIYRILLLTISISFFALLITFLLVWRFSEKAVQPEIENNRRQKEFITNASHELKTPLAVIRANTELIEMTAGASEWTQSTLNQVERVEGLIKNLVMIARSQEQVDKTAIDDVDLSKTVGETVDTYEAVARQTEKTLRRDIAPDVHLVMDESKVRQLATILLDNAMKYCDEKGEICVSLQAEKKGAVLAVSNTYQEGKEVDYSRFFDRFYRNDTSHNIDRGGYGIGLSIAETICRQNGGNIRAFWQNGLICFECQLRAQKIVK